MAVLDIDLFFREHIRDLHNADEVVTTGIGWSILKVERRAISVSNTPERKWLTTPTTVVTDNAPVTAHVDYKSPYSLVHAWTMNDGISNPASDPVDFPSLAPSDPFCPSTHLSVMKAGIASKIPVKVPIDIDAFIVVPPHSQKVVGPAVFTVPFNLDYFYDFTVQGSYTYWYRRDHTTVTQLTPVGWGTLFNDFHSPTVTVPDLRNHPERVIIRCGGKYTGEVFHFAAAHQEDASLVPMPSAFPLFPQIPDTMNEEPKTSSNDLDPRIDFVSPPTVLQGSEGVPFSVFGQHFTPACIIIIDDVSPATTVNGDKTLNTILDRRITDYTGDKKVVVHDVETGRISNSATLTVVAKSGAD